KQEQINIATGEREAFIQRSEGAKQAAINNAQGEGEAIKTVAEATAQAIRKVAEAIEMPGGMNAVNLKVAEKYVEAFAHIAKESTTMILPNNLADMGAMISTTMSLIKTQR
ncbi:MAG TPA: band-7 C-terminal domain-containing protein, partial [Burkholderiales bacterium]|nr:band-7 C-terminal domain-containing protein [Burkholderiales bacterium]